MSVASDNALANASQTGDLDGAKRLLVTGADPKSDVSWALQLAAKSGHLDIVKLLLPASDPKADYSGPLRHAAENGHLETVRLLLPYSDYVAALKHTPFTYSSGCDLLLSCLPEPFVKQFMNSNPDLDMPRTLASLAAQSLSDRKPLVKSVTRLRPRS